MAHDLGRYVETWLSIALATLSSTVVLPAEEARYWQANLLFARVSEQAGHPPAAV